MIIGGFLSGPGFYSNMARKLSELSGQPVYICEINILDWLRALSARGWLRFLLKLKRTAQMALEMSPDGKVILVGHSTGGVIGRLYLSQTPFLGHSFDGLKHVSHLVTLGSPHYGINASPMRAYVQKVLPDACFAEHVDYISVAGTAVDLREACPPAGWISRICYRYLGGDGKTVGDGLVPVECAILKGSTPIVLEDMGHPFFFATNWYGKPENVPRWWSRIFPGNNAKA